MTGCMRWDNGEHEEALEAYERQRRERYKMKFDQIAIVCQNEFDHAAAMASLRTLGAMFDAEDIVTAQGRDHKGDRIRNRAKLSFSHNFWSGAGLEHEILTYIEGWNWHELNWGFRTKPFLSHFGVHENNLAVIEDLRRRWSVLQEVITVAHENPALQDRRYHYVILDTRKELGAELKVIRRLTLEEAAAALAQLLA